ncbi:AAA family ATPase [Patescibacteria group bacterium]|nr:AAA family ATPase [Patescibacteria group bacterium]
MPNAKEIEATRTTILNVGSTGSGKTAGFLTLPGKKFLYIFDPNTLATLMGHDVEYELFSPEHLDLDAVTLKANVRDRISTAPSPSAYIEFEKHIEKNMDTDFFDNFDVIGLDSITTFQDTIMDRITHLNGRFGKQPEMTDYVATTNTVIKVFRTLLSFNKLVYVTGHIDFRQEEATSKMMNVMDFIGRLRRRIPILFSEVWYSYGEPDKQDKMHYFVRTQQDRYNPYLRCTNRFIDPTEDVTIDWTKPPEGQGIGGLLERSNIVQGA